MGGSSTVLLISAVLFIAGCTGGKPPGKGRGNQFEELGFELIGKMPEDNSTSSIGINRAGRSISLYVSPPYMTATQLGALQTCRRLFGDLLFILNDAQYDDVQLATYGLAEPFWTSAMYDDNFGVNGDFVWFGVGVGVNPSFIRPERACTQNTLGYGLAVQGSMSNFGMCSGSSNTVRRYICRV